MKEKEKEEEILGEGRRDVSKPPFFSCYKRIYGDAALKPGEERVARILLEVFSAL